VKFGDIQNQEIQIKRMRQDKAENRTGSSPASRERRLVCLDPDPTSISARNHCEAEAEFILAYPVLQSDHLDQREGIYYKTD